MSEWWTYGLSDFLMFSPEAYWRLVARHNATWGPLPWIAAAMPAVVLALLRHGTTTAIRAACLVLAAAWAWLGATFFHTLYAEIFLAAPWIALACGLESLALAGMAGLPLRPAPAHVGAWPAALLAAGLAFPLLAPLVGHPWAQAEMFAFMPDPTALATVGALAAMRPMARWTRWLAGVIPGLLLVIGAATRWLVT